MNYVLRKRKGSQKPVERNRRLAPCQMREEAEAVIRGDICLSSGSPFCLYLAEQCDQRGSPSTRRVVPTIRAARGALLLATSISTSRIATGAR